MTQETEQRITVRGVDHYYEWISEGLSPAPHSEACAASHSENSLPKPVMVFIHGWGGSARYWRKTAKELSQNFDCLLYDLRGFGRSKLPQTPVEVTYELEEYALDLAALLDALNIKRVYLHSHSMGASVAAFFIDLFPERVEKAILACNGIFEYDEKAFSAFHKFGKYVVQFRYPWFLKIPLADRLFMARFLHRPIEKDAQRDFLEDFILADYEAALGTIYTSVSQKAVEVMPQKFAQFKVPTLLISGEKDIIIPAAMGRQAAALNENISYVEIPKTAHFPMLEDAPTYLQEVQKFLQDNSL
ncbi:alpha/beta fold hydrolase [Gloeothece verrucosa]|uniref:Alpha/beta hydrolase fold protein n=1 Tax=Gloeothece verrucosa (strain PCC 7822) TaxID=497965 RepID=E0U8L0_GLOV7|nr:alpha/beta hydrolase [Gloeothece verrucosa]ADN13756.1 alpha/beta hydrolase fold protein [Gloeothece verrucosa PCC 7822]